MDTRHQIPKVSHLLGIILADKQDFTGAAERFRTYLKFAPMASDAEKVKDATRPGREDRGHRSGGEGKQ